MKKELGLPYMGSKRKIAKPIVDYILAHNPNAKYVFDLFGGGGAMSFEFLQRKQIKKVVYNELNAGICELLRKIRADGVTDDFYRWVSRSEFEAHKNDGTWYGGLLATCWSFGNNQKDYMFGAKIEEVKRLLHEIIVNKCDISRRAFAEQMGVYIDDYYLQHTNIQKRRFAVMGVVKAQIGRCDLDQLERLQQLQQLEQLEQLQQLEISNKSAFDVAITTPIAETIIYLDPPYANTARYAKDVCHTGLMEYIYKSQYKIYVSSYEFNLPCVFETSHRSRLSATNNSKKVIERLFCNKSEQIQGNLFGAAT